MRMLVGLELVEGLFRMLNNGFLTNPEGTLLLGRMSCVLSHMGFTNHLAIFARKANMFIANACLINSQETDGPRRRPNSQVTDVPRTMADTCCPNRCSTTGLHGTRLKLTPSSSIAKRPLASWRERR